MSATLYTIAELEWKSSGYHSLRAKTVLGNYEILPAEDGKGSDVIPPGGKIHREPTVGKAKQWAQKDFERQYKAGLVRENTYDHSLTPEELEEADSRAAVLATKELIRTAIFHGRTGLRIFLGEIVGDGKDIGDWEVKVRRTREPKEKLS